MSIPKEFKQAAVEQLGIKPEMLEALEKKNAEDAAKAKEAGIQFKEKDKDNVEEQVIVSETVVEEQKTEPVVDLQKPDGIKIDTEFVVETTAEAKTEPVVEPVVEPDEKSKLIIGLTENLLELNKLVAAMQKELQEVKDKSAKTEEIVYHTPSSSLNAILAKRAVGAPETRVKGSEHLAHLKPKQAEPNEPRSFVPFLNKMLTEVPAETEIQTND